MASYLILQVLSFQGLIALLMHDQGKKSTIPRVTQPQKKCYL